MRQVGEAAVDKHSKYPFNAPQIQIMVRIAWYLFALNDRNK